MKEKKKRKPTPPPAKSITKKRAFVDNYLRDFNARRAYIEVYAKNITDESAATQACTLLKEKDVQVYLTQCLEDRKAELKVDQNYVVRKLLEITEADFVDSIQYLTKDQIEKIPKDIRRLIQSIKIAKSHKTDGDLDIFTQKYEVQFMSKDKALELLGKHTGAFMKDNINANIDLGRQSFTDALKELDV